MQPIRVRRSARYGVTRGWWKIGRRLAKRLCGGTLPKIGWEHKILEKEGLIWNMGKTRQFPHTWQVWVENRGGRYVLKDDGGLLDVREINA